MDGIESFCEAGADLSSRSVLDVRTAAEVESNPLVGPTERLVHIPVDELRDRISELGEPDPKVVWVVTCSWEFVAISHAEFLRKRTQRLRTLVEV